MKLLVSPTSLNQANSLKCDGVILGIKGLSVNMPNYFEVEDLKQIKDKEIFVSLNKNMHNGDLEHLKEVLLKLNDYNIKGVFFYDIAIVNLKKKLNLNYDLIWAQEHMTNNYSTVNFWKSQGVGGAYISSDITLREMQEIKENTDVTLFVNVFGYIPLFTSKRHLIDNYKNTFQIKDDSKIYYMEKEGKTYPLIDNNEGTVVFSEFILNGLEEMFKLNYDYYILNSFLITETDFEKVLTIFNDTKEDNIETQNEKLNQLLLNLKKGFFYEETVYKVK